MSDDPLIQRHHLYEINYCGKGSRRMARMLGIDWQKFLDQGMRVSEVEHIDDLMVKRVIEHVRKQENGR